ncbi:MAG: DHH family phosphoesterase [Anaerolineales bacterium]|nr:DHH family phosphoesterase [Anaerolineales bacterium]
MTNNPVVEQIAQSFDKAENIALISHIRPDGDALGSLLGLGLGLRDAGKNVQTVLVDGVPAAFSYLPGVKEVQHHVHEPVDLIVVLDCSDLERIGSAIPGNIIQAREQVNQPLVDIVIDHHYTNLDFGKYNLVEPECVATSAILTNYLEDFGLKFTSQIAEVFMVGILLDTLGFRTNNMNPQALITTARLMEEGANLPELYQLALMDKTYTAARYWGLGLNRMEFEDDVLWTSLTIKDRTSIRYMGRDDADLISMLSTIKEASIVVLFNEQDDNQVKVSWRAKSGFNVSEIALMFGGGGHVSAAGATLDGDLDSVKSMILESTKAFLKTGKSDLS